MGLLAPCISSAMAGPSFGLCGADEGDRIQLVVNAGRVFMDFAKGRIPRFQHHFRVRMSKLRLSFHAIKGSGRLGQALLYPDYWNFKIILSKGQHIFDKVLKSRIRMYGSLCLIKSQSTTK